MMWGAHVLDNYISPKLSELTACSPPEVAALPAYRGAIVLNELFAGIVYTEALRVAASIFILRLREATDDYRNACIELKAYISALPKHDRLEAHTNALSNFESCLIKLNISAAALARVASIVGANPLYKKHDRSPLDRLCILANRIKHFDQDILAATNQKIPVPLAPVWLVNDGLECVVCKLSFEELAFILTDFAEDAQNLAVKFPAEANQRREAKRASMQSASEQLAPGDARSATQSSSGTSVTVNMPPMRLP
ncbi:hypothetical protein [Paracraurococcus lichenis]|uniref:BRO1 domain-containing protein n=1 Tax=Paracraurococcus lichenis TaxID=3064888 RepID=A0ABT9E0Y8_9PROT|nr:hypothetical protein [Paracraurococcus sp. LOR1-02]MDO9709823.1 hypothetical protein [Paracraurococcus sp. LOR1-02]